jgi:hypothetical protein
MRRLLHGGALKANQVGAFQRLGVNFQIIHPGYDSQGRRRTHWTQIVYDGVPIWEWKLNAPMETVTALFDADWKRHIGKNKRLLMHALRQTVAARAARFKDGISGVEPAPALHRDGPGEGVIKPS